MDTNKRSRRWYGNDNEDNEEIVDDDDFYDYVGPEKVPAGLWDDDRHAPRIRKSDKVKLFSLWKSSKNSGVVTIDSSPSSPESIDDYEEESPAPESVYIPSTIVSSRELVLPPEVIPQPPSPPDYRRRTSVDVRVHRGDPASYPLYQVAIPVPDTTVEWLMNEVAQRYHKNTGDAVGIVAITTSTSAVLDPIDKLRMLTFNGELIAITEESSETLPAKYGRLCRLQQKTPDEGIVAALSARPDINGMSAIMCAALAISPSQATTFFNAIRGSNAITCLNLSRNALDDVAMRRLSDCVKTLPNLTQLDVSSNPVTPHGINALCNGLTTLTNAALTKTSQLTVMKMVQCGMTYEVFAPIAENIRSCTSLTGLYIANNPIGVAGIKAISDAICYEGCFVGGLDISSTVAEAHPHYGAALGNLVAAESPLHTLALRNNPVHGHDLEVMAIALQSNTRLVGLDLTGCLVDDNGWGVLCDILATNTTLNKLILAENALQQQGCAQLFKGLTNNTTLTQLDVRDCMSCTEHNGGHGDGSKITRMITTLVDGAAARPSTTIPLSVYAMGNVPSSLQAEVMQLAHLKHVKLDV